MGPAGWDLLYVVECNEISGGREKQYENQDSLEAEQDTNKLTFGL